MVEFEKETEMHEPVEAYLKGLGFNNIIHELPCGGKVPDVIAVKNGSVAVSIECKLSNWKKALYQATIHTMFAERAYMAMPPNKEKLLQKNVDEIARWGVGVIIVSAKNGCWEIIPAKLNDVGKYAEHLMDSRAYIAPILKKSQYKTLD